MPFRFICTDSDNFTLIGTDDEQRALEWAENELVYDTQRGVMLHSSDPDDVSELLEMPELPADESED